MLRQAVSPSTVSIHEGGRLYSWDQAASKFDGGFSGPTRERNHLHQEAVCPSLNASWVDLRARTKSASRSQLGQAHSWCFGEVRDSSLSPRLRQPPLHGFSVDSVDAPDSFNSA